MLAQKATSIRPNQLTLAMQEAILMIGFGVSAGPDGYYSLDDPGERLNLRSAEALARRGLIYYFISGGAPMRGNLRLTPIGEALFEEIRELHYTARKPSLF